MDPIAAVRPLAETIICSQTPQSSTFTPLGFPIRNEEKQQFNFSLPPRLLFQQRNRHFDSRVGDVSQMLDCADYGLDNQVEF